MVFHMSGPPLPVRPPAAGASLYRCRCVVVSLLINAKSMLIEAIRCRSLLIETCVWAPLPMRRCIAANQFQVNANRCNSLQICCSMLLNAIQCCSLPIRLINRRLKRRLTKLKTDSPHVQYVLCHMSCLRYRKCGIE
jgi:hypothetical protein